MKILLFDIETSPLLANIWSLWTEVRDFKFVDVDWYVLSWSAKWLDSGKITTKALPDFKLYKKDPTNDIKLLEEIWHLLDEADIVVGHNAKKFDCKKLNTRFVMHGMKPPSPYKIVDTLQAAKTNFSFTSNRLDALGKILGVGSKLTHDGFGMWRDCLNGDMSAWKKMKMYNRRDVVLLEKIYIKILPYIRNHPNVNLSKDVDKLYCTVCGSSHIHRRGYAYTGVSKFAQYVCLDCGKWSRSRNNMLDKEDKRNILCNIS
jgi:RNase P subunit RPR2